jgi:hypothetical protein
MGPAAFGFDMKVPRQMVRMSGSISEGQRLAANPTTEWGKA